MNATNRILMAKRHVLAACIAACCVAAAPEVIARTRPLPPMTPWVPTAPTAIVTNCDDSGPGSLRDTWTAAVDGDIIDLTQLNCSTITLTTGGLVMGQNDIALVGPGRDRLTIDGSQVPGYSVIYNLGGGTLHLTDMTITGGSKYRLNNAGRGGCVYTAANLDLERSMVTGCTASANGGSALGGAIFSGGLTYLRESVVSFSHTRATGYASGGGVYALGGIQMAYSTIERNYCYSETGTPGFGGGLFARGPAFIMSSTISDNNAIRMGGAALADNGGNTATIINSTISGNTALEIGGVFIRQTPYIYNSTIAFNNSSYWTDGANHYFAAGLYIQTSGQLQSTIIANNVNSTAPFPTADLTGASGAGFSGGNNNVMFCGTPCPTDTSHEDPGLHPLMDNGGPTRTHVPTPGQWDTFGGTNLISLPFDQRGPGFPRQSPGDWPEIGALQINSDIIFVNGFNG